MDGLRCSASSTATGACVACRGLLSIPSRSSPTRRSSSAWWRWVRGTWAYLELTDGVNLFRRAIGLAGLVYIVVIIAQRFGA